MPVATKVDATPLRPQAEEAPDEVALPAWPNVPVATPVPIGTAQLRPCGALGTKQEIQDELDQMAFAIRAFGMKQPDQVLREVAGYSARLTELAVLLHRVESMDRQYTRVRTQQVERWQKELELQFKVASRLIEVQRQDIVLLGGMA